MSDIDHIDASRLEVGAAVDVGAVFIRIGTTLDHRFAALTPVAARAVARLLFDAADTVEALLEVEHD